MPFKEKSKRRIGPVFLRHHHFGPEFVLRVNHRVEPLLRSVLLRLKVDIPTVTRHIHHPRASFRHDTLSFSIDQTSTGQDQVVLRARHDYQSVPFSFYHLNFRTKRQGTKLLKACCGRGRTTVVARHRGSYVSLYRKKLASHLPI